jgi:hypothetical protein
MLLGSAEQFATPHLIAPKGLDITLAIFSGHEAQKNHGGVLEMKG